MSKLQWDKSSLKLRNILIA